MGKVVPFKKPIDTCAADNELCKYYDFDGDLGISLADDSLQIIKLSKNEFTFKSHDRSFVIKRNELAEFLHVASVFVDSARKWAPDEDLIGVDY